MATAQQIDKKRVADSFSRAATTYDSVAELQRAVGAALLDRLPDADPQRVMDLGSGTGFFTPQLKQRYPQAGLISLDLAEGMLAYARSERPVADTYWICGDAEALPLADNSVDLIFSSLAIQWCENRAALMSEVARVLRPGGVFCFATLGPDTLHELRSAWAQVDNHVHVNQFCDWSQLLDERPETLVPELQQSEYRVCRYQRLRELTDELKRLGAHNMNAGQPSGLTGRARVRAFSAAYEEMRHPEGYLPATYQVFYGVLRKVIHG
jgi:malonyl-CoA O-methyltransferase